jgi:hypothetical protein
MVLSGWKWSRKWKRTHHYNQKPYVIYGYASSQEKVVLIQDLVFISC